MAIAAEELDMVWRPTRSSKHPKFKHGSRGWNMYYANDGNSDAMLLRPVVHFDSAAFLSCSSISLSENVKKYSKHHIMDLLHFPRVVKPTKIVSRARIRNQTTALATRLQPRHQRSKEYSRVIRVLCA